MDIKGLKRTLPVLLKHKVVPFLWGAQGIGKTQTVKQIAKENKLGFVHLHLATQEVGDLVGLLIKNDDGTVKHARPTWFPTEGSGIIFLDEFNRATPDVLQCMFSFLTEGTIHTHRLPIGWGIVVAGNYQTNQFNVTDVSDTALTGRFCHLDVKPTVSEWLVYAENKGGYDVASFIRDNSALLEIEHKEGLDFNFVVPDRRRWADSIIPLESEDLGDYSFEVYSGIVGKTAAASYVSYKKKKEKSLSANDLLSNYSKLKERVISLTQGDARFDILTGPIDEIITRIENDPKFLNKKMLSNFKSFLNDIPIELSMKVFKRLSKLKFTGKDDILNDPNYIKTIVEGVNKNEVA